MATFTIEISEDDVAELEQLVGETDDYPAATVVELLEHLARCAADGVRRPGAWEREWIVKATGAAL